MPLPLDLLLLLPLPVWQKLLRAHGAPAPKTLLALRAALDRASPPLAAALRTFRALAPDAARPAVLEAAAILGVALPDLAPRATNAELVAGLLVSAARDPASAEALEAAKYRLCRREPTAPSRRYAVAASLELRLTPAWLKKLAAAIERAGDARQAPGGVDVAVVEEVAGRANGPVTLEIVRPDPTASVLVRGARGAVEATRFAPVQVDRVVIERVTANAKTTIVLWIATAAADLLPAYRAAIGAALFGDASLFAHPGPLSFHALERRRQDALDVKHARTSRLKKARVVAILRDSGREETIAIAGRNVLAALERDDLPSHGQIIAARIRLDFDDGPVDVTLRGPNVVHWEPCAHDAAIRAFLDSLGLDAPVGEDIVTLAPHDHPAWRWRAGLRDAVFEWLLENGCFAVSSSRALAHPEHAAAGRVLLAFELSARRQGGESAEPGRHYAVPEEGFDVGARLVTDADLVTYRLDVAKLATVLARALDARTTSAPVPIERGTLVEIGDVLVGAAAARLYLVVASGVTRGLAARLRAQSGGAHPVLVTPPGYRLESGCIEVELASLAGPYASLRGAIGRALGISEAVGFAARVPEGVRIAVDEKTGAVFIDGVEMVAMPRSTQILVRVVVEAGGKPVPGARCDERISPARTNPGAAKAAKKKFVAGAKESFRLAGREAPGDLEGMIVGTGVGYRVAVRGWIG